jgi:2-polyprenyl-3-methyl-5-hydroxy-6-metoxy-1,4-benzoquinol methylase
MSLRRRDDALTELMDDPACDPARLAATYRRFAVVNRLVSGWGTVWRGRLAPALRALDRPVRVLDLGSGGGDLVVRLASLARRDGMSVTWTGADPDPRAHAVASAFSAPDMRFVCADSADLLAAGERYDAVISNHVLHHLDAAGLDRFARESRSLSTGLVLHSDIERGVLPYALYAIGIAPLAAGTFLYTDGLRSIRRSYRPAELAAALGDGWRVETPVAFRLLAEAHGDA